MGEKTVTIRPRRAWPPWAARRRPAWLAFRIAKTTFSVSCGSSRTSETSASSASSRSVECAPEARTITGAAVCSRIAASSFTGSEGERVAWSTAPRWPPARADAAWLTCSLAPTTSSSGWFESASRSFSSPSHVPVK